MSMMLKASSPRLLFIMSMTFTFLSASTDSTWPSTPETLSLEKVMRVVPAVRPMLTAGKFTEFTMLPFSR